jgi:transketolase
MYEKYKEYHPKLSKKFEKLINKIISKNWNKYLPKFDKNKSMATRKSHGVVLNAICDKINFIVGIINFL